MNELLVQFIPGALECRNPYYPSLSDAPHQSVPTSSLMVYNLQLLFWYKFLAWQKSGCPEQELAQVSLRKRGLLWIFTQQNCRKWKSGQAVTVHLWGHRINPSLCLSAPWALTASFSKRHLVSGKDTVLFPHSQGQVSAVASVFITLILTPTPSDPLLYFPTSSGLWNLLLFRFSEYLAQDGSHVPCENVWLRIGQMSIPGPIIYS